MPNDKLSLSIVIRESSDADFCSVWRDGSLRGEGGMEKMKGISFKKCDFDIVKLWLITWPCPVQAFGVTTCKTPGNQIAFP